MRCTFVCKPEHEMLRDERVYVIEIMWVKLEIPLGEIELLGPISLMLLRAKPILLLIMLPNNDLVYPKTVNTKAHQWDIVTGVSWK